MSKSFINNEEIDESVSNMSKKKLRDRIVMNVYCTDYDVIRKVGKK